MTGKCVVCGKESTKRCSKCHQESYCSRECQVQAWKEHKKVCKEVKIVQEPVLRKPVPPKRDLPSTANFNFPQSFYGEDEEVGLWLVPETVTATSATLKVLIKNFSYNGLKFLPKSALLTQVNDTIRKKVSSAQVHEVNPVKSGADAKPEVVLMPKHFAVFSVTFPLSAPSSPDVSSLEAFELPAKIEQQGVVKLRVQMRAKPKEDSRGSAPVLVPQQAQNGASKAESKAEDLEALKKRLDSVD